MENGNGKPDHYDCPICNQRTPCRVYGIARSAHLKTHGINTKFISPEHRDDAEFIRRYFAATHVDVKGELDQQDANYARHLVEKTIEAHDGNPMGTRKEGVGGEVNGKRTNGLPTRKHQSCS